MPAVSSLNSRGRVLVFFAWIQPLFGVRLRRLLAWGARPIAAGSLMGAIGLGGCAQRPQEVATSHGKEYFPSSIYGPASKRVIADGQPVPRGGGQYLVGKPYTVAGRTYYPSESRTTQIGYASWYGDAFHGRLTANGEVYDRDAYTAASPTMPIPSYARVTNLRNNYSMIVRVNDRGPYASNRIMDVSRRVAEALDYKRHGTTLLKVEYVARASLAGSDDARLYATLRTGDPVSPQGERTLIARTNSPRTRVAMNAAYGSDTWPTRRSMRVEPAVDQHPASRRSVSDEDRNPEVGRRPRIAVTTDRDERKEAAQPWSRGKSDVTRRRRVADAEDGGPWHNGSVGREKGSSTRSARINRVPEVARARWERKDLAAGRTRTVVLPPNRPMDLGTIPGAASQIHAYHEPSRLRLARSHD